jgi:hypothetical protein
MRARAAGEEACAGARTGMRARAAGEEACSRTETLSVDRFLLHAPKPAPKDRSVLQGPILAPKSKIRSERRRPRAATCDQREVARCGLFGLSSATSALGFSTPWRNGAESAPPRKGGGEGAPWSGLRASSALGWCLSLQRTSPTPARHRRGSDVAVRGAAWWGGAGMHLHRDVEFLVQFADLYVEVDLRLGASLLATRVSEVDG